MMLGFSGTRAKRKRGCSFAFTAHRQDCFESASAAASDRDPFARHAAAEDERENANAPAFEEHEPDHLWACWHPCADEVAV